MKKKLLTTSCLSLLVLVLASCEQAAAGVPIPDEGFLYSDYFGGKGLSYKDSYNAILGAPINKELNYLRYNDGALASHWANFEDGLLLQNEYGTLEKQMAKKVINVDDTNTTFEVEVKEGNPWVDHNRNIYTHNIDGRDVEQYVGANDFVAAAKYTLNGGYGANNSALNYLYMNFIVNAAEYFEYTYMAQKVANAGWDDPEAQQWGEDHDLWAEALTERVRKHNGYENYSVTAADLDNIANFSRVGVKVVEGKEPGPMGGGTVRYTLMNQAPYFPTLLAYSCYLPVNSYFMDDVSWVNYGKDPESMLYCGPFVWSKKSAEEIAYVKNPHYFRKDRVLVNTVNYKIYGVDESLETIRKSFEDGDIDGFSITKKDVDGWAKYILGEDKTGTLENPANPLVNSREYNYIDYVYGLQINVNRASSTSKGSTSKNSYSELPYGLPNADGNEEQITNAEKALKIKEVRQFVLEAFDTKYHALNYSEDGSRLGQYSIHNFVPEGFITDTNNKDYTTEHYYKAYAEWYNAKNNTSLDYQNKYDELGNVSEYSPIAKMIRQGQYEGTYIDNQNPNTVGKLNELRGKAIAAIDAYNVGKSNEDQIKFPVQMEYFSSWADDQVKAIDREAILLYNQRLNNSIDQDHFDRTNTKLVRGTEEDGYGTGGFLVIPTANVKMNVNHEVVSNGGNWDIAAIWGWGPDYGDPMSYMNTYAIHGDWSNILGFVADDATESYELNENGELVTVPSLLGHYTEMVKEANAETDNTNKRYDLFAEAEVELINELGIFKPLIMTGQGRRASVSRAAGYHNPQGSYGLAKDRNDGLIVLTTALDKNLRAECTKKFNQLKSEYLARHGSVNIY